VQCDGARKNGSDVKAAETKETKKQDKQTFGDQEESKERELGFS
jgi:hypothetical protein